MGILVQGVDHGAPDEREIRQPVGGAHRLDRGIVDFDDDERVCRSCQRVREIGGDALANGRERHDVVIRSCARRPAVGECERAGNRGRGLLPVGRMTPSERGGPRRDASGNRFTRRDPAQGPSGSRMRG